MIKKRPIVLGIVGDSAAGKTTITRGLTRLLGPERVTHVCADDYHKYDRVERARLNITALHPDCNYLDILELHLERAHYGQPMLKPVYDHRTGSLVRPEYLVPREFVIVEGLLGFHTPDHAAVLRCQSFSRSAGGPAAGLEDQARYLQAGLHRRAGAGGDWRGGKRIRATSFARSVNLPTWWCASLRPTAWARTRPTAI